jgi:hypothetical protein
VLSPAATRQHATLLQAASQGQGIISRALADLSAFDSTAELFTAGIRHNPANA